MRCVVVCCFALALLVAVGGCRSCNHVEAELRQRENDVRELRDELDRCAIYNQTMQHELRALRGELGLPPADGQPASAYPVQTLVLGRQTGGRSNDTGPGDDALQVQVEPRDPEGQAIKAPGVLLVQVQEINKEGLKRPLSSWEISPEQLRKSWKNGLLTTGYVLNLPWKVWPSTDKLRVTALFQLADGRVFEADKDITIRVTPADKRPAPAPDASSTPVFPPAPKPADSADPHMLPAPRTIDPAKPDKPAPAPDTVGPFLGASRSSTASPNLWQKVEPPPPPPPAEILRPVPLKKDENRNPTT
jgi:hypothetical protein